MKYFYDEDRFHLGRSSFVSGYEIKKGKFIINFANGNNKEIRLQKGKLDEYKNFYQNKMIKQVMDSDISESDYKQNIKRDNWWSIYNLVLNIHCLYHFIKSSDITTSMIQGIGFILSLFMIGYWQSNCISKKEKLDEIEKYKYFLENEDLINFTIYKTYFEDYESNSLDINDIPVITINDLDKRTLIELKEIVELTKNAYNEQEIEEGISYQRKLKGTI